MANEELKACPFCGLTMTKLICSKYANGRTKKALTGVTANRFSRMCINRGCSVHLVTLEYTTQELTDAAWNHRQPDTELVKALEGLVEELDGIEQDEGITACQCLAKAPDDMTEPKPCNYCIATESLAKHKENSNG